MHPQPIALGGDIAATRRQRRTGVEQSLLEAVEIMGLDVTHVQRVAAAPIDKAAHRAGLVGEGLREFDPVQPCRRVEQRERALVSEALARDRREAARVEVEELAVARRHHTPVRRQRVGRFVQKTDLADTLALDQRRDHHRKPEGAAARQVQLPGLAAEGHAQPLQARGQCLEPGAGIARGEQALAPAVDEGLHRPGTRGLAEFKLTLAQAHHRAPRVQVLADRLAIGLGAQHSGEGFSGLGAVFYRDQHAVYTV